MKRVIFTLIIILTLPSYLLPQTTSNKVIEYEKSELIESLVVSYHDYGLFNGVILVAEHGKIILKKGYGYANREWNMPHNSDTKFRIASITKPFTAILTMQLAAAGKIDLNGKISDYLPDYRKDTGEKVTIHHLLSHSSGIPDYLRIPGFWQNQLLLSYSRNEFVKQFCSGDLEFEPGAQYKYCNSAYYILGMIIESVTEQSFEIVLDENILKPLQMKNTGMDNDRRILEKRSIGYTQSGFTYVNVPYLNIENIFGAGQMYSTVEDLYLWDQGLYTDKLLQKEYKDKLFTPCFSHPQGIFNIGYGWEMGSYPLQGSSDSVMYARHFGGLNGFNTLFCRLPEDKHLIVLLCNLDSAPLEEMSISITNILYNKPYVLPRKSIALELIQIIEDKGIEIGIEKYHSLKSGYSEKYDFAERELNSLGYYLLRKGSIKEALEILSLNVEIYPKYANGWDSLAEACMKNGDEDKAIKYYKKSLELNPNNANASTMLKKLTKK